MDSTAQSLLTYSKIQQSKRVQALLLSKLKLDTQPPNKIMVSSKPSSPAKPSSSSPSIIKIFPSNFNKANLPASKNVPKVVCLSEDKPSTSTASANQSDENIKVRKNDSNDSDSNVCDDPLNSETTDEVVDQEPVKSVQKKSVQKSKINILKRSSSSTSTSIPNKQRKAHIKECCPCCRETLQTILNQQQEILTLLQNTSTKPAPTLPVEKLDLLPPMPFDDVNDFLDFDESLTNENVQYQFMVKVNKLLVPTKEKSVSNIMSSILSNELCKSISWIGVKDTVPFGTSNMVGLIVDLVQEHHQVNIDAVKNRIAEWLRRCGDRINNELRRRQKRIEQGYSQ